MVIEAEDALFGVTGVAAEQFVAAVACQQLLDAVFAGAAGTDPGRHGGGIAEVV